MNVLFLTLAALIAFASNSVLCRAALAEGSIDPVTFTSIRLVSGALTLALLAKGRIKSGNWISSVALAAYAFAFSVAYLRLLAGTGALILFAAVQVTMLGASGRRPSGREAIGLCAAMGGLVALTQPWRQAPELHGALLMAAAGVAWGVYSLRGRKATEPLLANAGNFARSLVVVAVAAAIHGRFQGSSRGIALAVASGALASGCGYAIWYAVLPRLTATRAGIVQLAAPPLAALGGVAFLGEPLSGRLVVCGAVILGGVAISISGKRST